LSILNLQNVSNLQFSAKSNDMIAQKPTIVLIPGAWHTPDAFGDVVKQLEEHGYEAHALHLPTAGKDLACTPREDAAFIQETTRALAEEGKDIVLVMHSYGGLPGSDSAKGLLKRDRKAEGKQGGITHLVYIAAFLLAEGQCSAECLPKELPDWVRVDVRASPRLQLIVYCSVVC
jgi:pimeloyl-ACP methyl ester carboxylesterase